MVLIDTYREIGRREILDCRIKSLKEWVRHYGLHLHSYEVLLLSEALSFQYNRIAIPGIAVESMPYATASHNRIEEKFCSSLGISCREESIPGDEAGWERMKSLIDGNTPVLFRIDSRFLMGTEDASPRQMKLNLYYLSTLLLAGYDESQAVAYVVLTNDDERDTVNEIGIDAFQRYRCSVCAPFSPEGKSFFLDRGAAVKLLKPSELRIRLLDCLMSTADTMLSEDEVQMDLGSFSGTAVLQGIRAMEQMKTDLMELIASCEAGAEELLPRLMTVFLRNNLMFGSYSAFREEFGLSIQYVAEQYQVGSLNGIGRAFEDIARLWKELFVLLSRIAHSRGGLHGQLLLAVRQWEQIAALEREQYAALRNVLIDGPAGSKLHQERR